MFVICDIQSCVSEVTSAHNRELLFRANEPLVIKLQALTRGLLARRRYNKQRSYYHEHESDIVKLQVLACV